ncbi:MAG: FAD-dependent oxidoreductase [Cellvibrionaceae bacterium]
MDAVWNLARAEGLDFPPLRKAIEADVVIVGAGATGMAAALMLKEAGERVVVLEADRVVGGNTGGSTGNLYATLSRGLASLCDKWDQDTVNQVVSLRRQALDKIENNVKRHAIDCQFERRPLHFCIRSADSENRQKLEKEYEVSRAADLNAGIIERPPGLSVPLYRALRIEDQAQYNPVQYIQGLAKAVDGGIYEKSPVIDVDAGKGRVSTPEGEVSAGHIVFATHTPKGINMVQAEMEPYREYGVAAPLQDNSAVPGNAAAHGDYPRGIFWMLDSGHSLRSYQYGGRSYVMVIGQKHQTGHGDLGVSYYRRLEKYAAEHFNIDKITHRWSAQQYQAADLLPYIGRSGHDNVYIATGYGADGLVWGEVAAELIGSQILGRQHRGRELLTPRRFTPAKSAKVWLEANTKVARHLSTDYFTVDKVQNLDEVAAGRGRVVKFSGDSYAVYRSPEDELSTLSPLCPHMKCMVNWNAADNTWDCPCHGSRFAPDGQFIEGPAYSSLEKREPPAE